jgi:hypothetical protein
METAAIALMNTAALVRSNLSEWIESSSLGTGPTQGEPGHRGEAGDAPVGAPGGRHPRQLPGAADAVCPSLVHVRRSSVRDKRAKGLAALSMQPPVEAVSGQDRAL